MQTIIFYWRSILAVFFPARSSFEVVWLSGDPAKPVNPFGALWIFSKSLSQITVFKRCPCQKHIVISQFSKLICISFESGSIAMFRSTPPLAEAVSSSLKPLSRSVKRVLEQVSTLRIYCSRTPISLRRRLLTQGAVRCVDARKTSFFPGDAGMSSHPSRGQAWASRFILPS